MQLDQLKRREFISLLGGGSLLAPFAASAQEAGRTYRLAVLTANAREAPQNMALLDELRRYGLTGHEQPAFAAMHGRDCYSSL